MLSYVKNVFSLQCEIEEPQFWVLLWGNAAVLCVQHYCDFTNADNARREQITCHMSQRLRDLQVFGLWLFFTLQFFYITSCPFFIIFPPGSCIFNLKNCVESQVCSGIYRTWFRKL